MRWAKARGDWLAQFLELPEGIPAQDGYRRVLIALQPQAFQECFAAWLLTSVDDDSTGDRRRVAISGKTCRGSHDRSKGLGPLHIVSASASEQGIALGQVATEEKSNEIMAIPQPLRRLDLARSTVSIDALGRQQEIVAQIHKAKGAYVIAIKDHQPTLRAAVEELVQEQLEAAREDLQCRVSELTEQRHGRIDERSVGASPLRTTT